MLVLIIRDFFSMLNIKGSRLYVCFDNIYLRSASKICDYGLLMVVHLQLGFVLWPLSSNYMMDLKHPMAKHLWVISAMIRDLKSGTKNLSEDQQILAII